MATESITQFPALSTVAGNDLLPIVDVSDSASPTGTTKKTLVSSLQLNQNAFNSVFNVMSPAYGAVGNGTTEDSPAFLAAITAASAAGGGIVYVPLGTYLISTQLVLPAGVSLIGSGMGKAASFGSRLRWAGGSGFCVKAGNTAGALSQGIEIANLGINITTAGGSGLWLYGVKACAVTNVYIEGQVSTPTSIAVQVDGADCGAFFILLQNVTASHVFKGFVHTTTGSVVPTQVTGINCSAFCDNTAGSKGIDIQSVAGSSCGDGVSYVGGNVEECLIGVNLAGTGSTILGMRFENTHGTSSDITFAATARNNQIIGGSNIYTVTDTAGSQTNQLLAVPKDEVGVTSQMNLIDQLTLRGGLFYFSPNGTAVRNLLVDATGTYTGKILMQAGGGSAGFGGGLNLYGHTHATHPGDVVAGISTGSNGKFRVNNSGVDGGTDFLVINTQTGIVEMRNATYLVQNNVSFTDHAAGALGTLTNAPAAGNPTKWIAINDNGTVRFLPAW